MVKRLGTGITVNGAYLRVKGDAAPFDEFVTVPGLGSFTLPDEVGAVNDVVTLDGIISTPAYGVPGQIVAPLGALTTDYTHQWLKERKLDGKQITIEVFRLATEIGTIEKVITGDVSGAHVLASAKEIKVVGAARKTVAALVTRGVLVGIDAKPSTFVNYDGAADTGVRWQLVTSVSDDGATIGVLPGFTAAAIGTAAIPKSLYIRNPGIHYENIVGVVNGFGNGDFQAGGLVSGNLTFTPKFNLPVCSVYHKTTV